MNLSTALQRAIPSLRLRYEGLSDEKKLVVAKLFTRHARACAATGCPVDPQFLLELIGETEQGRNISRSS